jgi:hypothetical protein
VLFALAPPDGRPEIIRQVDSQTASEGIDCTEGGGTLVRGGLGDEFIIPKQPRVQTSRCTWLDNIFSRMGRHEVFDVVLRFDRYAQADAAHAAVALIRPVGSDLEGDVCGQEGNGEVILVRVYVDWETTPNRWGVQLRGGESPWAQDQEQNLATVDLGPVQQGVPIDLRFDLFFDYRHGAATVWENGARVYDDRDRPLGFHFNCAYRRSNNDASVNTSARDLSHSVLRMQHGIYRNTTPAWTLTSTGFRFYCSQTQAC